MLNTSWTQNKEIQNIDKRKLEVLTSLLKECEGKAPEDCIPNLVNANIKLKKLGMNFTAKETELILDTLKETMTTEQKNKMDMIKRMFQK